MNVQKPMTIPLRVLIVEDSDDDTALLVRVLERGGYAVTFLRVDTPETMRTALKTQTWDVVISDYIVPQFGGLEALRIVKEEQPDIPFIIVSGTIGEEVAVAAMKAGAHDYIMKGNLPRLVPAVERELREAAERRARRRAEEQLNEAHRKYEDLVNSLAGIVYEVDARDFRFTFVSQQCERLLGYPAEKWIKELTWQHLIHPDDLDVVYHYCATATKERRNHSIEFRMMAADGRVVWIRDVATVVSEEGRPVKVRGVLLDITERKLAEEASKRAEEALHKSEAHFRKVIEDIFTFVPEAVIVLTEKLNVYKRNKAFDDIVQEYSPKLQYTKEELTERILQEIKTKITTGDRTEIRIPHKGN